MKREKIIALILAALLAAGAATIPVSAASTDTTGTYSISEDITERSVNFKRSYKSLFGVNDRNVRNYSRPSVIVAGKTLAVKGLIINGEYYIALPEAAAAIGGNYKYDKTTRSATVNARGLDIKAGEGNYTIYANDRAQFTGHPTVEMSDGRIYIPASVFAKATGLKLTKTSGRITFSGTYAPLAHASKFYREDEVFWLARIIHAESRGEPLLGKIAVGDVVLNRVKSPLYPNTIYSVIFDKKYGVQFSPAANGSIYNTPDFNSILAAKICLDGYMISPDVLFFLAPKYSTSSWIPKSREYLFSIGGHDFYK